ncbi:MAG: hypothetical protein UY23_C0006G0006 [Candidatus Jorgensenbacteria bacterium GW2011_GWA1_48_11]|uniref:Homing endonuclease LAGLIDADG domain-containing protein n=1 Tax=Candidatus Jorgensenbacteria bacterium GW2011_GWA1_48_11 TaxID=1618660 RepID=A0A0G1U9J5_9BACT|nr:MAG: hypothetical protein UY23_C0006G0006 [Candidatus Jorgensenbacteria bacterium GW2011_GWA1_48_11]
MVFPRKGTKKQIHSGKWPGFGQDGSKTKKWERNVGLIPKKTLADFYLTEHKSMKEIGRLLNCSPHKVFYWMSKYKLSRRLRSEATYVKRHPFGDPFDFHWPKTIQEAKLFGLGLGLYWGEGNRANKNSLRLGNTDLGLIKSFIKFLEQVYGVSRNNLRFGLQVFNDVNPKKALKFWTTKLKIKPAQLQKVIVTPSRGPGTYKNKSKYGVLTVQFHNKKLRDILLKEIDNLR